MREAQPTLPASPATPYRARCRFKDAIQRTENKIDKSSEGSTSTDQVRFSKRMKADTTDVLPRRDIADMRDVFDVMTKEEKDEWQRKQTFDFVMNVPSLQPYMTESLRSMYND
ncbi:hypothetical protein BGX27_000099 [Mortierella sp. AM989]|nr:hypothetical protein BGX27_000099 [Mortierella sp. AM989]